MISRRASSCFAELRRNGGFATARDSAAAADGAAAVSREVQAARAEAIDTLLAAVEAKQPHARGHARTVSRYSVTIAGRMKLPPDTMGSLRIAALLHDVGKIGVPDAVLRKPGPLTAAEFDEIKRHPRIGVDILRPSGFLANELPTVLHHHERYDGSGYPAELAGRDIPLPARILAVADALDAMLSPRSYKPRFDLARARGELQRCAGTQFDPDVAAVTVEWLAAPRCLSMSGERVAGSISS